MDLFSVMLLANALGVETANDPISYFFQFGLSGAVIAAILLGLLWAKPAVDQITKRAERAEAQRDALVEIYENKMLPALTESVAINKELKPLLVDVISTLGAVKEMLNQPRGGASGRRTGQN